MGDLEAVAQDGDDNSVAESYSYVSDNVEASYSVRNYFEICYRSWTAVWFVDLSVSHTDVHVFSATGGVNASNCDDSEEHPNLYDVHTLSKDVAYAYFVTVSCLGNSVRFYSGTGTTGPSINSPRNRIDKTHTCTNKG